MTKEELITYKSRVMALCEAMNMAKNLSKEVVDEMFKDAVITKAETKNSSWPEYDQPGQCGLCGSFHCSGNCFK